MVREESFKDCARFITDQNRDASVSVSSTLSKME